VPRVPTLRATVPLEGVRAAVAKRMHESLLSTAQLTFHRTVDAGPLVAHREALRGGSHPDVSYTDLIVLAVSRTLPHHPRLNATIDSTAISEWASVNIGIAVALDEGVMVPVLFDCQDADLPALIAERRRVVEVVRSGTARARDLLGSTFTVTNLGAYGVDMFTPVINAPEVAILGVGRITPRSELSLSLTVDHRAVDGAPAGRFLTELAEFLECPQRIGAE